MSKPPNILEPPNDKNLERDVLGAVMVHPEAMDEVLPILPTARSFYQDAHQRIYTAILELYQGGQPVTLTSVSHALLNADAVKDIGGYAYLAELVNCASTPWNATIYAKKVRSLETARALIYIGRRMADDAQKLRAEPDKLRAEFEQALFEIGVSNQQDHPKTMAEVMNSVLDRIDTYSRREKVGIETRFIDLDGVLGGLRPQELTVLAGRPGMGKSKLAGNIAVNVAKDGHPVATFHLEMSNEEVAERFACAESRVDHFALRNGKTDQDTQRRIMVAASEMRTLPIFWYDRTNLRPSELLSHLRRLKRKHGIELAIVDHLGLMDTDNPWRSPAERIGEISRMLKLIAKEARVHVLALCQMNRGIDSRHDDMPRLSDLRDSGTIEQDADTVLFLHRKRGEQLPTYDLYVAKQRNGPTTILHLYDDAKAYRFLNHAGE